MPEQESPCLRQAPAACPLRPAPPPDPHSRHDSGLFVVAPPLFVSFCRPPSEATCEPRRAKRPRSARRPVAVEEERFESPAHRPRAARRARHGRDAGLYRALLARRREMLDCGAIRATDCAWSGHGWGHGRQICERSRDYRDRDATRWHTTVRCRGCQKSQKPRRCTPSETTRHAQRPSIDSI